MKARDSKKYKHKGLRKNTIKTIMGEVVEIVPITDAYRKAETVIKETTNATLSFEWIRKLTIDVGDKIATREKEER